jgi:hypothetical protein
MAVTEAHARTAPASKRAEPRAVSPTLVAACLKHTSRTARCLFATSNKVTDEKCARAAERDGLATGHADAVELGAVRALVAGKHRLAV